MAINVKIFDLPAFAGTIDGTYIMELSDATASLPSTKVTLSQLLSYFNGLWERTTVGGLNQTTLVNVADAFGVGANPSDYQIDFPWANHVYKQNTPTKDAGILFDVGNAIYSKRSFIGSCNNKQAASSLYFTFDHVEGGIYANVNDTIKWFLTDDALQIFTGFVDSVKHTTSAEYNIGNLNLPYTVIALTSTTSDQILHLPTIQNWITLTVTNPFTTTYTKKIVTASPQKINVNGVLVEELVIPSQSSITIYSDNTYWYIKDFDHTNTPMFDTVTGALTPMDNNNILLTDQNTFTFYPENSTAYANYTYSVDLNYGYGTLIGTASVAYISNGWLILARDGGAFVTYSATGNFDSPQVGAIKCKYRPAYSGAPNNDSCIWAQGSSLSSDNNMFILYHTWRTPTPHVHLKIYDDSGVIIFDDSVGVWSPIAGTSYEFEVDYDLTNGATRVFIDGIQLGSTITATGTRGTINYFRVGAGFNAQISFSNGDVTDVIGYDTVQHTANYTSGYSCQFNYMDAFDLQISNLNITGVGTSLTLTNGDNSTNIATTAFVQDAFTNNAIGSFVQDYGDLLYTDTVPQLIGKISGNRSESRGGYSGANVNPSNSPFDTSNMLLIDATDQTVGMSDVSVGQTVTIINELMTGVKKAVAKVGQKFKVGGVLYDEVIIPGGSAMTFIAISNGSDTYWYIK